MKCPPGPLGRHCHDSSSKKNRTTSGSSSGGDASEIKSGGSEGGKSSSSGEADGSEGEGATGNSVTNASTYDVMDSSNDCGQGWWYRCQRQEESTSSNPFKAFVERRPIVALLTALMLISVATVGIIHRERDQDLVRQL